MLCLGPKGPNICMEKARGRDVSRHRHLMYRNWICQSLEFSSEMNPPPPPWEGKRDSHFKWDNEIFLMGGGGLREYSKRAYEMFSSGGSGKKNFWNERMWTSRSGVVIKRIFETREWELLIRGGVNMLDLKGDNEIFSLGGGDTWIF